MCENHVFLLPINILTVWHAGFLGRTTHYHVSRYAKQNQCLKMQINISTTAIITCIIL